MSQDRLITAIKVRPDHGNGPIQTMSRTRRRETSNGFWMRNPGNLRQKRQVAMADDALRSEGVTPPQRKPIPPDDWDDLTISTFRGQPWRRRIGR